MCVAVLALLHMTPQTPSMTSVNQGTSISRFGKLGATVAGTILKRQYWASKRPRHFKMVFRLHVAEVVDGVV